MKFAITGLLAFLMTFSTFAGELTESRIINFDNGIEISDETAEPKFEITDKFADINEKRIRYGLNLKSVEFRKEYETKSKTLLFTQATKLSKSTLYYVEFDSFEEAKAFKEFIEKNPVDMYFDGHKKENELSMFVLGEDVHSYWENSPETIFVKGENGKLISLSQKAKQLVRAEALASIEIAKQTLQQVGNVENVLEDNVVDDERKMTSQKVLSRNRRQAHHGAKSLSK